MTNLYLTEGERLDLWTNCFRFFFDDDDDAIRLNIQVSTMHRGIILYVYAEAKHEDIWLFYCNSTTLGNFLNDDKAEDLTLTGYWLNRVTSSMYDLLLPEAPY